ncbi:MAG: Maf family protein [bacterium]|nr:Maf family protein [bacterium]
MSNRRPQTQQPTAAQVILASASLPRRDLLAQLAIPFTVMPADIEEHPLRHETPRTYVLRVAKDKAYDIAQRFPDAVVLGADTAVIIDQQILGKPTGDEDAKRMLSQLSGRLHQVITGLACLRYRRRFCRQVSVCTTVRFRELSAAEIEHYVATHKPFDKAGAYAIQGQAATFVDKLDGCYTNVVGLPLSHTAELLRVAGLVVTLPERSAKNAW